VDFQLEAGVRQPPLQGTDQKQRQIGEVIERDGGQETDGLAGEDRSVPCWQECNPHAPPVGYLHITLFAEKIQCRAQGGTAHLKLFAERALPRQIIRPFAFLDSFSKDILQLGHQGDSFGQSRHGAAIIAGEQSV
jgi:hypothetical protein